MRKSKISNFTNIAHYMKLPILKSVHSIDKYKIDVHFLDGTNGIYDLGHLAGRGVFKIWDNGNNFYKVFINPESKSISWPGELDIDTINVYCTLKNIKVDEYLKCSAHHAPY